MNEPIRTQWEIRCAFNAYCKRALMNEKLVAYRDMKRRQLREISFSDLTQQEEDQLCTYDTYFANDEAEKSFFVAGKEITAKLLAGTAILTESGLSAMPLAAGCYLSGCLVGTVVGAVMITGGRPLELLQDKE